MKERKIKTLGMKMLVPLVCISIVVTIVGIISFRVNFKKVFDDYIEENTNSKIERILQDVEHICSDNNIEEYYIESLSMKALEEGFFISIYDINGKEIFDIEKHNSGMCVEITKDIMRNMGKLNTETTLEEYNTEIRVKGDIKGYLKIKYYGPTVYLDREINLISIVDKTIITIGIILIVSYIFIAYIISKKINIQVNRLMRKAEYIAKGYYDKKVNIDTDILEIRNLEKSINSLSTSVKNGEDVRKRLTSDISHELKTPLTNIESHLEAIIDGVWEPTEERLRSIKEETERLTDLVKNMEKLNKYDKDAIVLKYEEVNIYQLINGIIDQLSKKIAEKDLYVSIEESNLCVFIDKGRFIQAIMNLIANAINYSYNKGNINIHIDNDNNSTNIYIEDSGIGISEEDLPHIFERFYRVDKSRAKLTGGSGIGLSITKSIIEAHGGEIKVSSTLGKGATFKIILPNNIEE